MMAWVGAAIGAVAILLAVSLAVGLALGRILRTIDAAASRLLDDELWAFAPLTREVGRNVDDQRTTHVGRRTLGLRAR
jgi:hypothetical protein